MARSTKFKKLMEPGYIGSVKTRNRILKTGAHAGFQGVELNGACVHLLNSFLSRDWNRRHDEYGVDSMESRAKIFTDIIRGIKQCNGDDFAIIAIKKKQQAIEADTIVAALPLKPNTELFKGLKDGVHEVYAIGDSKEPNLIIDAIANGSRIGHAL